MFLFIDLETRSTVDLPKSGAYRYWEDPTTDVWLACYALGDGPVQTWHRGEPCPRAIADHVKAGGPVSGWNAGQFERLGWERVLDPRYGWPVPKLEQFDDTAAAAAAMGLPRGLGDAAAALGLEQQKDMEGRRLMLQMSRPRRTEKDGTLVWWDDPEKIARLAAYCAADVEAERAIRNRLVPLSAAEREVWLETERINDLGVPLDVATIRNMIRIVDEAKADLDREMTLVTGGVVKACSQVSALTAWLREQGVPAESLAKAALEDLLAGDWAPAARRALELRKEAAKASTAKLNAAMACVCRDGRVHGTLLYHGASTGRWTHKLIQTGNYPRGSGTVKEPEKAMRAMRTGSAATIRMLYDNPMAAVSDCLRATIAAHKGRRLIAADFSSIEGRVTAWLAGEQWKLDAFSANDAGTGAGIYELTAAEIFACDVKEIGKKDPRRQVGKTAELALGFAGGVNAFYAMAKVYGVKMEEAFPALWERADEKARDKAEWLLKMATARGDAATKEMSREAWLASELTKQAWRKAHPATVDCWKILTDAVLEAVLNPGRQVQALKVTYLVAKGFLWCRLPSGRCLAYASPRAEQMVKVRLYAKDDKGETVELTEDWPRAKAEKERAQILGEAKSRVTALGVNGVTRKWERYPLGVTILVENVVQAIARDLMANGALKAAAAGYPTIMLVHDEAVCDVPAGFGSVSEYEALLCDLPAWAEGIPLTASGYEALRYKKD